MLETNRLRLELLDEIDELDIIRWRNDKEIIDNLFSFRGVTLSEHRKWFERYLKSDDRIEFIIHKKDDGKKLGTISLSSIDYKNQKAEYGILIGEKSEWGKSYAKEASFAILEYGFKELNLEKIYLKVFIDNTNAINLYKNLGFTNEGILRKDVFKNGIFKDVLTMSILRDEWKKKND
ncbi:MAG: GNAT family N-acetyltransferase [Clostridia bacterium]